jgi:hypothetical protein
VRTQGHRHVPGNQKDGGTYYVDKYEYQRYWCAQSGCNMSIPVRTGNTRTGLE